MSDETPKGHDTTAGNPTDIHSALRKAATIIQRLERRIEAIEYEHREPIAIVGLGCRLPGNCEDLDSYWSLLTSGRETVATAPSERTSGRARRAAEQSAPELGSFISGLEYFDAEFWGLPTQTAESLDPQHRLLLECAWEAIEHAGFDANALRGSRTGVYTATGVNDYAERVTLGSGAAEAFMSGLGACYSAGRISGLLAFNGPAMAVDTACSSSLVAVHLACRALRARDCDYALAGAAQALRSSRSRQALSELGALSPDGRCKSLSAKADGYAWGEGCGVVILRRLSDARAAGERILAVIKGTAVNHDGERSGQSTPNPAAQMAVLEQALQDARCASSDIDYVETHAIGTRLGDTIELEAIASVYGPNRGSPLRVGSSKANIGHLEHASGMAGLIKLVAMLRHGYLPRTLHSERLNPDIDWGASNLEVVNAGMPWSRSGRPRRAGLSAFGLSGTNAHIIVEEAPEPSAITHSGANIRPELVVISARTTEALAEMSGRLAHYLGSASDISLQDLAYNLAETRTALSHRLALVAASREELALALLTASGGKTPPAAIRGRTHGYLDSAAWVLSGENGDPIDEVQDIADRWPVFGGALRDARAALDAAADAADLNFMRSQSAALAAERQMLDTFAVQWALGVLWESWAGRPSFIAGHSVGEIAAACIAGILSLGDAAKLVLQRAISVRTTHEMGSSRKADLAMNRATQGIEYKRPRIPFVSGVTGTTNDPSVLTDDYWASRHTSHVQELLRRISAQRAASRDVVVDVASSRGGDETEKLDLLEGNDSVSVLLGPAHLRANVLLSGLGKWFALGGKVDWKAVFPSTHARLDLPRYPWQRKRYWIAKD